MSAPAPARLRGRVCAWRGEPFSGAKIAAFFGDQVLAYLRDDKPGLLWPNCWDLPGGGREGDEDPIACALRELQEEFGLQVGAGRVDTLTHYLGGGPGGTDSYFACVDLSRAEIAAIRFGDEGQHWALMHAHAYIFHARAVPPLQARLAAHWAGQGPS